MRRAHFAVKSMHEYRRIAARRETTNRKASFRVAASRFDISSTAVLAPLRRRREVQHMDIRDWIDFLRIQLKREEGQTMAEYGVLIGLITVVVVATIALIGTALLGKFNSLLTALGG
jgi:pilus assembly protein Flp/PilA